MCEHTRTEWFIAGTEPTQPDNIYQQVTVDTLTGALADPSATPEERRQTKIVLDLPISAQPWARSQGLPLLADVARASNETAQSQIALISPRPNTTYRFDPTFDASAQKLLVEAVAGAGITQVTIWVDGAPLAVMAASPYQAFWQLSVGEHRFWATGITVNGETVTSEVLTITVQ